MAGYSGAALATKLGIREGSRFALVGAPPGVLPDLPPGVAMTRRAQGRADVVLAFFTSRKALEGRVARLAQMIFPAGGLWVAWPKRSSRLGTDITDHVVREIALPLGLVDNKVCAVDDTWTGLRVVWRLEHRAPASLAEAE